MGVLADGKQHVVAWKEQTQLYGDPTVHSPVVRRVQAGAGLDVRRVVAAAAALLGGVRVMAGPARGAYPGQNGRIAFETLRDGNSEIYAMNPDGSINPARAAAR